jgi:hypothetical protein
MVVVIAATAGGMSNYLTFINGELYEALANVPYPPAMERQNAWLGRSGWGDPYLEVELDTFRIYDSALTVGQVTTLYELEFPHGAPTTPATGGVGDDVLLAEGVSCTGWGTLREQTYEGCNVWANCYTPSMSLVAMPVQAPADFEVSHIGLFSIANTSSSGQGDNRGTWLFRFGLYSLNDSTNTLQLLAETDAVNVTDPGISSSYVVIALHHGAKYRLPAALTSSLYVGSWFAGNNGNQLSFLQPPTPANGDTGIDATDSMPTAVGLGNANSWGDAIDLLDCGSTDALILQSMP